MIKKEIKVVFFGNQHIDSQKTFDERRKHQTNAYLKDVISKVHEADELYIFGPAETKTKLEKKILEEKSSMAGKLKSVESAENNMTTNQIVAKVKKFYNL